MSPTSYDYAGYDFKTAHSGTRFEYAGTTRDGWIEEKNAPREVASPSQTVAPAEATVSNLLQNDPDPGLHPDPHLPPPCPDLAPTTFPLTTLTCTPTPTQIAHMPRCLTVFCCQNFRQAFDDHLAAMAAFKAGETPASPAAAMMSPEPEPEPEPVAVEPAPTVDERGVPIGCAVDLLL